MLYKCLQQQNLVQFLCKRTQILRDAVLPRTWRASADTHTLKNNACRSKTAGRFTSQVAKPLSSMSKPIGPIEAIERELHLLPKLFERLAAH